MRALAALLIVLGAAASPVLARTLEVELDVQHVAGLVAPADLDALLADPRLVVEASYRPTRLIDGVTARRERTMPIGSRLFEIGQTRTLQGAEIERQGRVMRFRVPGDHPAHASYRLVALELLVPMPSGPGRPQPDLRVRLVDPVPDSGAHESAAFASYGAFDLGWRLRLRWSDAQGSMRIATFECHPDIRALGEGRYLFRPRHRLAGLFQTMASDASSDPPTRAIAGQRSFRLREPLPDPLAGWTLSRNHLLQRDVAGAVVQRLSIYAEQAGPGACRRARAYDALFGDGKLVAAQRSDTVRDCGGDASDRSETVEVQWLDDGTLARYVASRSDGSRSWDAFRAVPRCSAGDPPSAAEVQALQAELQRLRDGFLRP